MKHQPEEIGDGTDRIESHRTFEEDKESNETDTTSQDEAFVIGAV
jgi:hypothetical protein